MRGARVAGARGASITQGQVDGVGHGCTWTEWDTGADGRDKIGERPYRENKKGVLSGQII